MQSIGKCVRQIIYFSSRQKLTYIFMYAYVFSKIITTTKYAIIQNSQYN